jgi:hypothetical protein
MPLLLGDPRTAPVALSKIPLDLGVTAAKGEVALLLLFSLTADRERKIRLIRLQYKYSGADQLTCCLATLRETTSSNSIYVVGYSDVSTVLTRE